jgi:hypothetical protein
MNDGKGEVGCNLVALLLEASRLPLTAEAIEAESFRVHSTADLIEL